MADLPKDPNVVNPYDTIDTDYSGGEASPEEQAVFSQAYDNLVAAGNQAPTTIEIENEVNRLQGNVKPIEKTRAIPKGAEQFYESTGLDEKAEKGDYPDQMGKKFKPKDQMPKKKKRPQSVVKLSEKSEIPKEYWGNPEDELSEVKPTTISEYKYPDNAATYEKLLNTAEEDGHITSHERIAEYIAVAGKEIATEFDALHPNEQDTFWDSYYKKFLKKISKIKESSDGMSLEPRGDEIEQVSQEKEENGDEINNFNMDYFYKNEK